MRDPVAISETTMLELDWEKFDDKFGKNSVNTNLDVEMLRTIKKANISDYLVKIPVFSTLSHSKLELVSRFCRYSVHQKGSPLCSEGEVGEEVYILLSRSAVVTAFASKAL